MVMSLFENKMVLLGPFVGSIGEELLTFLPFVNWIRKNFNFPNMIVSSHYNRSFFYDKNIPIFKQYTKDEISQNKHKHDKIKSKDFIFLTNEIRDQISLITNFNKGDIVIYNLGYSQMPSVSIFQKIFEPFGKRTQLNDKIIYLPESLRKKKEHKFIFNFLRDKYDIEICGDTTTFLQEQNLIVNDENYYDNGYSKIIEKLLQCKAVITPCCHWTLFCNIHKIPVFSWGKNSSLYKGIYNFNNSNSYIIPHNKGDYKIITKSIEDFLRRL